MSLHLACDAEPADRPRSGRAGRRWLLAALSVLQPLYLPVDRAVAESSTDERPAWAMRLETSPPETIDLLLTDRIELSHRTSQAVMREVERVLSGLGAAVRWQRSKAVEVDAFQPRSIEIVLSARRPEDAGQNRRTMGIAFPAHGPGLASGGLAIVFPYKIAEVVTPIRQRTGPMVAVPRGRYFSQALGRVIAHEVIHIVLPEHPHSTGGLMNATQNRRAFAAHEPVIDKGCARAFQAALLQPRHPDPSRVATVERVDSRRRPMTRPMRDSPPPGRFPPPFRK